MPIEKVRRGKHEKVIVYVNIGAEFRRKKNGAGKV